MDNMDDMEMNDLLNGNFSLVTEDQDDYATSLAELKSGMEVPLLPVRNMVMFPKVVVPITAGRKYSKALIKEAEKTGTILGVISQKNIQEEFPQPEDLHQIGTLVKIIKVITLPDGNITAIVRGLQPFKAKNTAWQKSVLLAKAELVKESVPRNKKEYSAVIENLKQVSKAIIDLDSSIPNAANFALSNIADSDELVNFISLNASLKQEAKQLLLEQKSYLRRAHKLYEYLTEELNILSLRNDIHQKTSRSLDKQQREYYLNQQMKTIQEELGGGAESDVEELSEKAKSKKWNAEVEDHFSKELKRLERLHPSSPDYNVQRNYLETLLGLPWDEYTAAPVDIEKAREQLDADHYGLKEIKRRILEYLSVLKLKADMKAPILCLNGPPGVGKTSLGKSVADSLGRKYIRISLGGLHDESEIRGHRKTYIGAMPGRIIQSMKKAGVSDPVIVLDEIDKIGQGVHGDPSSALLEVLDPEQNHSFYDNFLELGYDLSKVLFIATSNSLKTIQSPLLDRMEVIQLSGYTTEEKIEIAKRYLIPKQKEENGLSANAFSISKKNIEYIISAHTRESGVRKLNAQIGKIARNVAYHVALGESQKKSIKKEDIDRILGVPMPQNLAEITDVPGVVTGLAWTSVGGDILFIESILSDGKGSLSMTGSLGEVMKESATIALEYLKAKYQDFGIDKELLSKKNIHIHVPEGATPKDGPSAGIAMLTSMVSSYLNKKVKSGIAMTGEITLRGKVLPVGGIKEKILAAKRAGIEEVILCADNKKDVEEIEPEYIKGLKIHYVDRMSEVIDIALEP